MKKQYFLGLVFLFIQLLSIFYARFVPERFFCWAPYDEHTYYEVFAEIDGIELTKNEINKRYRYKSVGWEPRSIYNVFDIIDQYECTYGKKENAKVEVTYEINGGTKKSWFLSN